MPHTAPGGPLQYHGPWKGVGLLVGPPRLFFFWLTHTHPRRNRLSDKPTISEQNLPFNDGSLGSRNDEERRETMKNAAKRDM